MAPCRARPSPFHPRHADAPRHRACSVPTRPASLLQAIGKRYKSLDEIAEKAAADGGDESEADDLAEVVDEVVSLRTDVDTIANQQSDMGGKLSRCESELQDLKEQYQTEIEDLKEKIQIMDTYLTSLKPAPEMYYPPADDSSGDELVVKPEPTTVGTRPATPRPRRRAAPPRAAPPRRVARALHPHPPLARFLTCARRARAGALQGQGPPAEGEGHEGRP